MRISVVIPCFNHEAYVAEAIDSVAAQQYSDCEVVVVDDGSSDDSVACVEACLADAKLARSVLHQQPNAGAHAAIMKGLELATGDCLTILNSDDFYLPGRFEAAVDSIGARDRYVLFTRLRFVDAASRALDASHSHVRWYADTLRDLAESPTVGFGLLRGNASVTSGNLIFSRAVYEAVGAFSSHRFCHDWDFLMRATRIVEPELIDAPLMGYRVHDENATHGLRDVQEAEVRDAFNRYLDLCREAGTLNPTAPCPGNWPRFFERFALRHAFHFGADPIAHYIDARNRDAAAVAPPRTD